MRKSLFLVALTGLLATTASAQQAPGPAPGVTATANGKAWPKFPLNQPPGSNIGNVTDTNTNGVRALVVNFNSEAQPKDVFAEFDKQLKAGGYTVVTAAAGESQTLTATKGKESIAITVKPAVKGHEFSIAYNTAP